MNNQDLLKEIEELKDALIICKDAILINLKDENLKCKDKPILFKAFVNAKEILEKNTSK